MQEEVTIQTLIIVPLKGWKSSNKLVTASKDQNSIQEKIKSRMKSENACYHSVQNLISFRLLFNSI